MSNLDDRVIGKLTELAPGIREASQDVLDAVLEAMFLMATADGDIGAVEVAEVARACGKIVGGVTSLDVEEMFGTLQKGVEKDGWDARVAAVGKLLVGTGLERVAFRLASGVALADDYVAGEEAHAMDVLALALGISDDESHVILREVHVELFG